MKKIFLFLAAGLIVFMLACNNDQSEKTGNKVEKSEADSLLDEVIAGHDVVMPKMGALMRAREKATELLDSITKLPAKAQEAAAPYKTRLNNVIADLNNADSLMDKWMTGFDMAFATNDSVSVKERVHYLLTEKVKVNEMKDAMLNSLKRADSVLKERF
jgi:hypothetical protein